MKGNRIIVFGAALGAVAGIAAAIELTGGLPSQLAHVYYFPVVVSALLLPRRLGLAVALLAAAAVSPLPDVVHRPLGLDLYYSDASPWNLTPSGWIVRPVAFIVISILASRLARERAEKVAAQVDASTLAGHLGHERTQKMTAEATSAYRGKELTLLSRIDKMILSGSSEEESIGEIARLVEALTGAKVVGVALANHGEKRIRVVFSHPIEAESSRIVERSLPLGEGVAGWAILNGKTATCRNVFLDPRYDAMAEFARRAGYVSSAGVPIVLDEEVLGALALGYEEERDFSPNDVATLERIADQAAMAIANARQRASLQRLAHETAIALADAIESRDPYTGGHCVRLAQYAALTARALGLSDREVETIRLGAALHDVGKIVVPDHILKKPSKLTPDEYAVIKQHCYSGGQICKRVSFLQSAYPIVYHHHERYDGRGYPDGISGEAIPLGARIVALVDAHDAMTNDRPYRKAMSQEEAEAILRDGAGTQWDPQIVETFLSSLHTASPKPFEVRQVRLGSTAQPTAP